METLEINSDRERKNLHNFRKKQSEIEGFFSFLNGNNSHFKNYISRNHLPKITWYPFKLLTENHLSSSDKHHHLKIEVILK